MNRLSLKRADLQSMVVFEALIQERGVSKVADKLFMTQPTVSAALARLRAYFDDPLFIRVGNRMEPTPRALQIIHRLRPALDSLSSALSAHDEFSPSESEHTFHIGVSDDVELALLPDLVQSIRRLAPLVKIVISSLDATSISEQLLSGIITLAIAPARDLPAIAKQRTIKKVPAYTLTADRFQDQMDFESFCARPHIDVASISHAAFCIDEYLEAKSIRRDIVMTVTKYSVIPGLLSKNRDCITVVPKHAADFMSQFYGIGSQPLPFCAPVMELHMAWLPTHDTSPKDVWIRKVIRDHIENQPY